MLWELPANPIKRVHESWVEAEPKWLEAEFPLKEMRAKPSQTKWEGEAVHGVDEMALVSEGSKSPFGSMVFSYNAPVN